MGVFRHIEKHGRSLFYALVMGCGLIALKQIALSYPFSVFLISLIVLELFLLIETYLTYKRSTNLLKQFNLPAIEHYDGKIQFIYHIVLPFLMLFSLGGFIYTNSLLDINWIIFIFCTALFFALFVNISAYYRDKFELQEKTHYIYDVLKIFIFFAAIDTLLNISSILSFDFFIVTGLVFSMGGILTFLVLIRRRYISFFNILLILLVNLSLGYLTASIDSFLNTSALLVAYFSTLIFYIFNAIIHHELEKTLRFTVMLEYILTAIVSFLIILLLA